MSARCRTESGNDKTKAVDTPPTAAQSGLSWTNRSLNEERTKIEKWHDGQETQHTVVEHELQVSAVRMAKIGITRQIPRPFAASYGGRKFHGHHQITALF